MRLPDRARGEPSRIIDSFFRRERLYSDLIMYRPSRRAPAFFVAIFLALGMSLSTVHASNMAVGMAMASDMGAPGQDGCNGCDDSTATGANCVSVCPAPSFAVLLSIVDVMAIGPADLAYPDIPLAIGRASPPDLHPPRTSDHG